MSSTRSKAIELRSRELQIHQDVLDHPTTFRECVADKSRTKGLKNVLAMQFCVERYMSEPRDDRDYAIEGKGLQRVFWKVAGTGPRGGKKVVLIEAKRNTDYKATSYNTAVELV